MAKSYSCTPNASRSKSTPVVYNLIKWTFIVTISVILIVSLTLYWVDYSVSRLKWQLIPNPILLLISASIMVLGYFILCRVDGKKRAKRRGRRMPSKIPINVILVAISILFLVFQIFLIRQYYFETAWDADTVKDSAMNIIDGKSPDPGWWPDYYDVNPNNRTIVSLFVVVIKVMSWLTVDDPVFGLILFQCAVSWATGIILYLIIKRVSGRRRDACFGWLIYAILVGLNPWISIPYSDSVALILPVAMLYLLILRPKNIKLIFLRWFSLGALGYFSLQIKPQTTIMFIAIVMVTAISIVMQRIRHGDLIFTKNHIVGLLAIIIGMVAVCLPLKMLNDRLVPIEPNRSLPIMHYLMMGMNDETDGVYSGNDVWFISLDGAYKDGDGSNPPSRIVTTDEIAKRDFSELVERLKNMGVDGLVKLLVRKTLVNFNDGAFAWSGEGGFYWTVRPPASELSESIREMFYIPDESNGINEKDSKYEYFQTAEQGIWLAVLLLSVFSAIRLRNSRIILTMMLGVIGLIVYELLFEARARYVFTFVPIFIILAVMGLTRLHELVSAGRSKVKAAKRAILSDN